MIFVKTSRAAVFADASLVLIAQAET